MLQAGIELVGRPGAEGTAEALEILASVLDATGLEGIGSASATRSLYRALLDEVDPPPAARARRSSRMLRLARLRRPRTRGAALDLGSDAAERLIRCAAAARRTEVLDDAGAVPPHPRRCAKVYERLPAPVRARVIFDLGLQRGSPTTRARCSRSTTPALGAPLGGGGRYDDLLGRFGRDLPAVGWALGVERIHLALYGEGRWG
jgi:ATP phosphoribosyltransferase regulatory subunit HisZ